MKQNHKGWLVFATGLFLCLTAAILALIDALIPRAGALTLNITLLAALFVMGLVLSVRGLSILIRNKQGR